MKDLCRKVHFSILVLLIGVSSSMIKLTGLLRSNVLGIRFKSHGFAGEIWCLWDDNSMCVSVEIWDAICRHGNFQRVWLRVATLEN